MNARVLDLEPPVPSPAAGTSSPPVAVASAEEIARSGGRLVERLRELRDARTLAGSAEAGRLIVEYRAHVYRGTKVLPGKVGVASYRRLATLPGMPLSSASLCRAVAIFRIACVMPELLSWQSVGVGHVSIVLRLPLHEQLALLKSAERHSWSRSQLRNHMQSRDTCPDTSSRHAAPNYSASSWPAPELLRS